ncbi:MAG TPA: alpha/beta hydrolase-fold protein [Caulobacteraceae bacterium]|jgi:hypothetical protein|nr:alpha/beta hydrolase-fold protein [Caulobacteraceae bacterium]
MRTLILTAAFGAFALTAQAQTPPAGGKPIVIGLSYAVPSAIFGVARTVNVYLPSDYADPKRSFPVLYLLDGGADEDFHHITGLVAVDGAYGAYQEMIVIGVVTPDRHHDLTSPSTEPADHKLVPTGGGADTFRRYLADELKPWVAAHYRTDGHTALMGESLAGLFTLETFLTAPQDFDDYISVSPSLWWNKQALSRDAEADLRKGGFTGKRLWLAMEDEGPELQAPVDRVVAGLKAANAPDLQWTYDPHPTERHDTIYDPVAISALRAFYAVKKTPH